MKPLAKKRFIGWRVMARKLIRKSCPSQMENLLKRYDAHLKEGHTEPEVYASLAEWIKLNQDTWIQP